MSLNHAITIFKFIHNIFNIFAIHKKFFFDRRRSLLNTDHNMIIFAP